MIGLIRGQAIRSLPLLKSTGPAFLPRYQSLFFKLPPVYNCSSGVVLGHSKIKMFSEQCSLYLGTLRKKTGKCPKSKKRPPRMSLKKRLCLKNSNFSGSPAWTWCTMKPMTPMHNVYIVQLVAQYKKKHLYQIQSDPF